MTIKAPPVWTREAAETVKSFLTSDVGSAAFLQLAESRPSITAGEQGNDINKAALSGQFAAGYEAALQAFLRLAEWSDSQTQTAPDNYPDPEVDSLWNDGQKFKEKKQ